MGIWSTSTGSAVITEAICDSRVMVLASGWVLLFVALWAWWPMGGSQIADGAKISGASHCIHIFNNHETVRNWEWVTAVEALPLVNSWRALWWKCSICSTFSTVKSEQWILHNACLWVFTPQSPCSEDHPPFNTFIFHPQCRVCLYFPRRSQVDSKQSRLLQMWICPWRCTLPACASNTVPLVYQSKSGAKLS